ncbi:PREDICTED: protein SIEVE ELEMENT OCCLUSION B-like isoform X2 [Ipomoea nil]|uniref:protein SIEVE ELEMENT OCCLUSION B-like isoform X2 n=1 Tax=Ipomoea nil TaxID=35883 RepID=UPI00090197EC|nr:PREDICTED: protein SIEVE ELEMENT OCCLUSION B-like isoform X2 [Ipomoea nil]
MEYQPSTSSNINESIILKEVMNTHGPVTKDFKANYILHFVKKILFLIMVGGKTIYEDEEESDDNEPMSNVPDEMEIKDTEHSYQIKRLSFEIAQKCSSKNAADDPHSIVMYFLKMLCAYPWEAKLLLMLAASSINFGEFNIQARKGSKTPLLTVASSHIRQSISFFIKSLLRLTDTIVELAQSSSYNSSPVIPLASYWIFTSIITFASYFRCLPNTLDSEWLTDTESKLSSLTVTLKDIFSYCGPMLEMKREDDSYNALWCAFSDENLVPSTNLDALKLIFNVKDVDKEKPLFDPEGEMVGLRLFENKKLILLITSQLDVDYSIMLASLFYEGPIAQLWIPILNDPTLWDTAAMENHYRIFANGIKVHAVKDVEKYIASGFARFVEKKFFPTFQIGSGPIFVLLDHQGRMLHCIATHMIVKRYIDLLSKGVGGDFMKRDSKIPLFKNVLKEMTLSVRHLVFDIDEKISDFANEMDSKLNEWLEDIESDIQNSLESIMYKAIMEEDPWKEKTWCTKFLIGGDILLAQAKEWVNANEHIFFIGGKDIKWVKTFASKVLNPQLTIKMAYVGSNYKVASTIRQDRICETLFDKVKEAQFTFWMNLQSVFFSRIKFLDETYGDEESDEIVKGLKFLLSYEAEGVAVNGWALLCKGNKIVLYDLGDKMLAVMNEYTKWKETAIVKGFDQAFKDHHHEMFGSRCTPQHHQFALEYPCNSDKVPENIKCHQCCHDMQKFVTFKCHHEYLCKEYSDRLT